MIPNALINNSKSGKINNLVLHVMQKAGVCLQGGSGVRSQTRDLFRADFQYRGQRGEHPDVSRCVRTPPDRVFPLIRSVKGRSVERGSTGCGMQKVAG